MKETIEKIKELQRQFGAVGKELGAGTIDIDWTVETVHNLETGESVQRFLKFVVRIPLEGDGPEQIVSHGDKDRVS